MCTAVISFSNNMYVAGNRIKIAGTSPIDLIANSNIATAVDGNPCAAIVDLVSNRNFTAAAYVDHRASIDLISDRAIAFGSLHADRTAAINFTVIDDASGLTGQRAVTATVDFLLDDDIAWAYYVEVWRMIKFGIDAGVGGNRHSCKQQAAG